MNGVDDDPRVGELRAEIAAVDRSLVDAVNRRIELVALLKRHKESLGAGFVDRARERRLVDELARVSPGPLSRAELERLYEEILELTKREVARLEGSESK